jgi:hypothetical protein
MQEARRAVRRVHVRTTGCAITMARVRRASVRRRTRAPRVPHSLAVSAHVLRTGHGHMRAGTTECGGNTNTATAPCLNGGICEAGIETYRCICQNDTYIENTTMTTERTPYATALNLATWYNVPVSRPVVGTAPGWRLGYNGTNCESEESGSLNTFELVEMFENNLHRYTALLVGPVLPGHVHGFGILPRWLQWRHGHVLLQLHCAVQHISELIVHLAVPVQQ